MSKINQLGGNVKAIPAYYEGQNANGTPDHFVSREKAHLMKSNGTAKSIHRGTAVLIKGIRRLPDSSRNSLKSKWAVVHQTSKGSLRPGFPRYNSI